MISITLPVDRTKLPTNCDETITYAKTLKVGDHVTLRYGTDMKAGTVMRVTPTTAYVAVHPSTLLNGVESGQPDAMTFTAGGFAGHFEGRQRYMVDDHQTEGSLVKVTFRKNDKVNDAVGVWRMAGCAGGLGKLDGVVYSGWSPYYNFNF